MNSTLHQVFRRLQRAHEVLSNPDTRAIYDSEGHAGLDALNDLTSSPHESTVLALRRPVRCCIDSCASNFFFFFFFLFLHTVHVIYSILTHFVSASPGVCTATRVGQTSG